MALQVRNVSNAVRDMVGQVQIDNATSEEVSAIFTHTPDSNVLFLVYSLSDKA